MAGHEVECYTKLIICEFISLIKQTSKFNYDRECYSQDFGGALDAIQAVVSAGMFVL